MNPATKKASTAMEAFIRLEQTSIRIYIVFLVVLTASVIYIAPAPHQSTQEAQVK